MAVRDTFGCFCGLGLSTSEILLSFCDVGLDCLSSLREKGLYTFLENILNMAGRATGPHGNQFRDSLGRSLSAAGNGNHLRLYASQFTIAVFHEELKVKGWCPFLLITSPLFQHAYFCYYALRFASTPCNAANKHNACTQASCKVINLDPDTPYVTRHTTASCRCAFLSPFSPRQRSPVPSSSTGSARARSTA